MGDWFENLVQQLYTMAESEYTGPPTVFHVRMPVQMYYALSDVMSRYRIRKKVLGMAAMEAILLLDRRGCDTLSRLCREAGWPGLDIPKPYRRNLIVEARTVVKKLNEMLVARYNSPMKTATFKLPEKTVRELDQLSKKLGVTKGELVRAALALLLEKIQPMTPHPL